MKTYCKPLRCLALLCMLHSADVVCSTLQYQVSGIEGPLLANVNRWLGAEPQSEHERTRFMGVLHDRVENGLQALGYYGATIDTQTDKSTAQWQLRIVITPNAPVRLRNVDIQINGAASGDEAFSQFVSDSTLQPGAILNHGVYETFKRDLQRQGQRRGYFDAAMTASRIEIEPIAATADISLHYQSGDRYAFGEIDYDHAHLTRQQLLALTPARRGDPYDVSQVLNLQSQLQQTGYFSSVAVAPQLDARANREVPIALSIIPAKTHSVDLGIGYSSDIEERVSAIWTTPRVNRWGHSLETRLLYSPVNPSIRSSYRIPMTHPLNDVLQFTIRKEENEYGDTESQQDELEVQRDLKSGRWVYSYSLRGLRESWDLDGVNTENDYLLPGVSLSHKNRQGPLVDPLSGLSQFYAVEYGSSKVISDIDLLRLYTRHVLVLPLTEKHRVVGRSELGVAYTSDSDRDQLAPSLRFFAGGSQSVRGYGYQSLGNTTVVQQPGEEAKSLVVGGSRLVTVSLEYQYYVNDTWRAAVFSDAGDAFDAGDIHMNYSAGFGLHYLTPVGAIKIEVARPVGNDDSSWRLHLNIGAEF